MRLPLQNERGWGKDGVFGVFYSPSLGFSSNSLKTENISLSILLNE